MERVRKQLMASVFPRDLQGPATVMKIIHFQPKSDWQYFDSLQWL